MASELSRCQICPRACTVNRTAGEKGFCGASGPGVILSRAALHFYEEPCISGTRGSGAVFFSGCSLRCIYCQNYEISRMKIGKEVSVERLAEIFLELQEKGAHNINLVTPTHYAKEIREAVLSARKKGLKIPTVWNTSGYERVETLQTLSDVIDIYLTDYKYEDADLARAFSGASDYPEAAKKAFAEMLRQKPCCTYDVRCDCPTSGAPGPCQKHGGSTQIPFSFSERQLPPEPDEPVHAASDDRKVSGTEPAPYEARV